MNYLKHLNLDNIDAYNKANPKMGFSYQEVADGLEHCVDTAAASIIEHALQKYFEDGCFSLPAFIEEGSEAVDWTNAISRGNFSRLVQDKIEKITNQENN